MRNLADEMKKVDERIKFPEQLLGKGLMQPNNNLNSSSRKIMFGSHCEQKIALTHPERPLVSCGGYEDQFGQNSSSFVEADDDYLVIKKIPKFINVDNCMDHYFMIAKNIRTNILDVFERTQFKHISETYGYEYDNSYIDELSAEDTIFKGSVIRKSTSFDEYNSRMDGVNLTTAYMATGETYEDGFIISESARMKLASPLVKVVSITLNENDTPLNLYGNMDLYKCMPRLGEEVKNSMLMGVRRENKEDTLFTHSAKRLTEVMMSDVKYIVEGTVVDVNIYCNNVEYIANNPYYRQIYEYYLENLSFSKNLVELIDEIVSREGVTLSYDLQKLYSNCKGVIDGTQYIKDKKFSNVVLEVTVVENSIPQVGDKLCNRYGGKGVIAAIWPEEKMPLIEATGERVECIFDMFTCCNRLNVGQLVEHTTTFVGSQILNTIRSDMYSIDLMIEEYVKYIKCNNPTLGDFIEKKFEDIQRRGDYDELKCFLYSLSDDNGIMVSVKPISNSSSIDQLAAMYDEFPYVQQSVIMAPITDSNGNTRMVKARRPLVAGKLYIYRLKQRAEEKFMATSLSATNIRSENARSKLTKSYTGAHNKTPIRLGEMEAGEMLHLGVNTLVEAMMIYSVSPKGRKLTEELLTGDPFNIDVKLDSESTNRNVEILNAYLKPKGLKLMFMKVHKKKFNPIVIRPMENIFGPSSGERYPIRLVNPNDASDFDEYINSRTFNRKFPLTIRPMEYIFTEEEEKDKKYMMRKIGKEDLDE